MPLRLLDRTLDTGRPHVMGVVNVTPDSFSDGGRYFGVGRAVERALEMAAEGATLVDIGGESTRPGARAVSERDEIERVVPVVEEICRQSDVLVSVDTSKPAVMTAAVGAGAAMINDVRALTVPGALDAAASMDAAVCIMHMQGDPGTMQANPAYSDVVTEIRDYLVERAQACEQAGIAADRIVIDPGFGFGKRLSHNVALMNGLSRFADTDYPLLVGVSRKSMIGGLLDREVDQRLAGGLALAMLAWQRGACIVRTHDVAETVDVLKVVDTFEP